MSQEANLIGKKSNKAFMILSALGILFVLDSHVGSGDLFFTQVFPYDSFFMPMFAFISGYFFSEKHIQSWNHFFRFSLRKCRTLLLPYLGWVLFYGLLTGLLRCLDIIEFGTFDPIDLIYAMLTGGTSFGFNDPAWFVPLLFCVIISYSLLRKLLRNHWNDFFAMVIFALGGAVAIAISQSSFYSHSIVMLLKVPCFLPYFHMAVLFRNHLEPYFDKIKVLPLCLTAVSINLVLLCIYGYEMAFPLYATMVGYQPHAPFLPLVTSITGICFWLKISKALVPILGQNPLVNFISDNTAFLMTHHLAVKHLFTGILLNLRDLGMECFNGIDVEAFRMYAWYTYTDYRWCSVACFLFTLTVLVILCKLLHRTKDSIKLGTSTRSRA